MASGGSEPPCNVLSPSATKRARLEEDEQGEVSSWPDQQSAPRPTWLPSTAPCEGERGGSSCGASSVDSGLSDTGATSPLERATPPYEITMDPNREEEGTTPGEQEEEDGEEDGEEEEDDLSSLGGLSDMSGQDWKPDMTGKLAWLHRAMARGENPRLMLLDLLPGGSEIPEEMDTMTLWKVMFNLLSEPPRREKLSSVNTLEDCVSLIRAAKNIIVLTGAGVSVSCGIPDFRSKDGVYARLAVDFPDLPDPQAMFDIHYFRKDPRPFFKFAREIYPGQFTPSPCHRFIRCLEEQNSLLRNYTQNIDTLEQVSGIEKVIQCHGSFATASCMVCKTKVDADVIRKDIFDQNIPLCQNCPKPDLQDIFKDKDDLKRTDTSTDDEKIDDSVNSSEPSSSKQDLCDPKTGSSRESPCEPSTSSDSKGSPTPLSSPFSNVPVMKPDIVFFGEGLPDHFHHSITRDKSSCDLLIVIGSSLKVRPVALIPSSLPPEVPQILINREPLPHCTFDVELLGDCDAIVNQICHMLGEGWSSPVHAPLLDQHTGVPKDFPQIEKKSDDTASHAEAGEPSKTYSISEKVDAKDSEADNIYAKESKVVENPSKEVPTDAVELEQQLPTKDTDQEDMEEEWKSKPSLSEFIPQGHYLFLPPARYVFSGAEVTLDSSDDEAERDELESLPDEDQDNSGNKSDDEEAALNGSDPAQTADLQSSP